jgi:glycosyltransferase involved in cell wall biosynthesis
VLLERCLRSIARLHAKPTRILVVDNAPATNEVPDIAVTFGADYTIAPQRGLSKARNKGAKACSEDVLAYVDDDMILHPDWLSSILAEFSDARIGGVTGPFMPLELEAAGPASLADHLRRMPRGIEPFKIDRNTPDWFERANFGGLGDGNFAIRRSVLNRWSGFDERLGRGMPLDGGEDNCAFFEIIEAGYSFIYTPRAIVFHASHPRTDEQILHDLTQSLAYAGFLGIQRPRYALNIIKYLAEGFFGKKRRWQVWVDADSRLRMPKKLAIRGLFAAIRVLRSTYAMK